MFLLVVYIYVAMYFCFGPIFCHYTLQLAAVAL